jgi:oxygen-independent coproporphyrinogen-3 oxidase
MGETMMLGLRLVADGVSPRAFHARHGVSLAEQFGSQIARMRALGLIEADQDRVRLSRRGAMLANSVCAEFL